MAFNSPDLVRARKNDVQCGSLAQILLRGKSLIDGLRILAVVIASEMTTKSTGC